MATRLPLTALFIVVIAWRLFSFAVFSSICLAATPPDNADGYGIVFGLGDQPKANAAPPQVQATPQAEAPVADETTKASPTKARAGDTTKPISLPEAIILALRENINVRSAYLDRVVQKFNLKVAEWKYVPKVYANGAMRHTATRSFTAGSDSVTSGVTDTASFTPQVLQGVPTGALFTFAWTRSKDILGQTNIQPKAEPPWPHIVYIDDRNNLSSWAVTFSQPLLRGAGIDVNMASIVQAQLDEQGNIQGLKSTLVNTVTQIITTYRNILQLQRQLRINQDALKRSQELIETNKLLINAGRMAAIDLIQAESDVANKELLVQQSSDSLDTARLNLNKMLNLDRSVVLVPQDEGHIDEITPDFDLCLKVAYSNRPDYLRQVLSLESAQINYMLAKNNSLWDLNAEGGYTRADLNKKLSPYSANSQWTFGLNLKIPVFGDLSRDQTLLTARIGLKKTELSLEDLKKALSNDVLNSTRDVVTKLKQLKLANRARELAVKKLEVEQLKLTLGRTSNFQVISYENDLRLSLQSELDATTNYRNSLSSLDQLLGTTLDTWQIEFKRDRGYRAEEEK